MKLFYSLFALIITTQLFAQSHTFTAAGGTTDWHTAANWSANTVPSSSSSVLIPDGFEVVVMTSASALSISLTGGGTIIMSANIAISEMLNIGPVALLNFEKGNLSAGTLENNGTIRFLTNQQKLIANTVLNNHNRMDFVDSNIVNLSGTVTINNMETGVLDILANGGLTQQNGANATLVNNGIVKKYTENGDFGSFYMILNIVNNHIIDIKEDSQFLMLTPQIMFHNTSTGILTGTGIFDITGSFLNEGTVSPAGDEVGELHFVNTFNLDGGTLKIDVIDENNFDVISVTGSPNLNGNIEVVSSYLPGEYYTIDILTSQFTIDDCVFPVEFMSDDGFGTILTFNTLCEPNKVSLEMSDGFIFSVEENSSLSFSVSPNPISKEANITLSSKQLQSHQLVIYAITGEKVKTVSLDNESTTFNRDSLAGGIYFAQLISEGKVISTEKLILK